MKKSNRNKTKIGRNDPCPCGSGLKYKRCCMNRCRYARLDELTRMSVVPNKTTSLGSITPVDMRNIKVAYDLLKNQQKY